MPKTIEDYIKRRLEETDRERTSLQYSYVGVISSRSAILYLNQNRKDLNKLKKELEKLQSKIEYLEAAFNKFT